MDTYVPRVGDIIEHVYDVGLLYIWRITNLKSQRSSRLLTDYIIVHNGHASACSSFEVDKYGFGSGDRLHPILTKSKLSSTQFDALLYLYREKKQP